MPTPRLIPGLTAADLKLNLQDRGFSCSGPDLDATGGVQYLCERGTDYIVLLLGRSPTEIYYVDATAVVISPRAMTVQARRPGRDDRLGHNRHFARARNTREAFPAGGLDRGLR